MKPAHTKRAKHYRAKEKHYFRDRRKRSTEAKLHRKSDKRRDWQREAYCV